MNEQLALRIKNWQSFQHYKDRRPPWIRLYRSLLDDFKFHQLTLACKALLPMLWLLASERIDGVITASIDELAFRLRMNDKLVAESVVALTEAGFIERIDDSAIIATCGQVAVPETETETETEQSRNILIVTDTFNYFLAKTNRHPKLYELSSKRMAQGLKRLKECLKKTNHDRDNAAQMMKVAIDGMIRSDWHMGRDPKTKGKKYNEWENVMRSQEQFERWLNAGS